MLIALTPIVGCLHLACHDAKGQRYINLGIIPKDATEKNESGQMYRYVWPENYQSTLSNCPLNPFG